MVKRPPPMDRFEKYEGWLSSGQNSPSSAEFDDIQAQKDEIYEAQRRSAYDAKRGSAYGARRGSVYEMRRSRRRSSAMIAAGIVRSSFNLETPIPAIRPGFDDGGSQTAVDDEDEQTSGDPYAHLAPEEAEILRRQVEVPASKAGFKDLFRYATPYDYVIITISALCSITLGAAMPLMTVIFGNLVTTFRNYSIGTISQADFNAQLTSKTIYYVYLAITVFCTAYIQSVGFIHTGERISAKIRARYLDACMRQNLGFFDKLGTGEFTTRIISDANMIQMGLSEKMGLALSGVSSFICSFVIGFVAYWKLTLIMSAGVVAIMVIMMIGGFFIIKYEKKALESYALGGSIAEEVISSVRNATAFGTQEKFAEQYDKHLVDAEKYDMRAKLTIAMNIGASFSIIYLNYALAFWSGSHFILDGYITVSTVLEVLMSFMIGAVALGNVAPHAAAFTSAVSAANKIYSTIDRVSPIDPQDPSGLKLSNVEGEVELRNIKHIYPSRPDVTVLHDLSLKIPAGKTTALVGASGSGKSTIVGLLERFYEPVRGQVFLDGHDINSMNIRWLRQQVALVSQEPTLFNTTVYENIRFGLPEISDNPDVVDKSWERQRIVEAAKKAHAHDFIMNLANGYDTNVGERGMLLSGGQKQRVAIARAIVSDPKILLLDEATSALDTKSESVVQAALKDASVGRTTISIAHRLSTIREAENIVVMGGGRILEQGTHDELIAKGSYYFDLVEAQQLSQKKEAELADEELKDEPLQSIKTGFAPIGDLSLEATREKDGVSAARRIAMDLEALPAEHEIALKYSFKDLVKFIGDLNRPEWGLMLLGFGLCIICGGANPTQAVFFGKAVSSLALPLSQADTIRSKANFWSGMYLMLAVVQFIAFAAQGAVFALCSARLVRRARLRSFKSILRQSIAFFDKNETGSLTSMLSTEATQIAGMSGITLGSILTVLTTLCAAIILSAVLGWKLALVCASTIPVIVGAGFLRYYLLSYFGRRSQKVYEDSAAFACEATGAIRTLSALTREMDTLNDFRHSLEVESKKSLKSVAKTSLLFGFSQACVLLCIGLGFWYGGTLVSNHEYNLLQFFICLSALVFGAQSAGTVFAFCPDMSRARNASATLYELFQRKPAIDTWSTEGKSLSSVRGYVEFKGVHFTYPNRPGQKVLRNVSMKIKPGQHVALVGASGCGKSTTIQLMERFYDPQKGSVLVDGKDIRNLNINEYRTFISLVSQEPALYQGTIKDNLLLGTHRTDVSDSELIQACQGANIYEFIMSLPDGFDTSVGSKGGMLSGGQKQRLAIARALLRNPTILLLDEATSALDSESERTVQAAIDKASKGRTTISIAHRLSTIQKADVIFVFDQGRIVEKGTHEELIAMGGRYTELVNLSSLS